MAYAERRAPEPVRHEADAPGLSGLTLAALGVVFGDIGTSPVYTFHECFNPERHLPLAPENVLGVLSLTFWVLVIVVAIKYVALIMRADNRGEGGIFALLALALEAVRGTRLPWWLTMLGLAGAALFYGDSMVTPAISVLSAVEGIGVATPALSEFIVPVTAVILVLLFLLQKRGTETVGRWFGPVMLVWFVVIGLIGLAAIAGAPRVLWALRPYYGVAMAMAHPWATFVVLGAVALAITGGEALYADMGHFGPLPIRTAWYVIVLPALVLNYFGQGALVLADKAAIDNPFFHMVPSWALWPYVLLTTAATVIASQSVISGAFSMTRQAIQLGLMPQLDVTQTSARLRGQIYVPQVNWLLLVAVLALVLGFRSSSALASAYGLAVTGTMAITTLLAAATAVGVWRWRPAVAVAVFLPLFVVDFALFSANTLKLTSGGWFPLVVGIAILTIMATWREGRQRLLARLAAASIPLPRFLAEQEPRCEARVSGTAVVLSTHADDVPLTLLNNFKHNHVLHERVLLVRVVTEHIPRVAPMDRTAVRSLGSGFWQVDVHFGFAETPDVPRALCAAAIPGPPLDPQTVSFFTGRAHIEPLPEGGMVRWRERLYAALAHVATRQTEFFHIPLDRVIEIGAEIEV
jgi:KUP system potassium uptake protein